MTKALVREVNVKFERNGPLSDLFVVDLTRVLAAYDGEAKAPILGDIKEQTAQTLKNLKMVLEASGHAKALDPWKIR